jgi:hypothetical protein
MKTSTMAALAAGAVVVGFGVYYIAKPKAAYGAVPTAVSKSVDDAASRLAAVTRSVFGAKAASGASAGAGSVAAAQVSGTNSSSSFSKAVGAAVNSYAPGTGTAVTKISGAVVSGLRSLKFW